LAIEFVHRAIPCFCPSRAIFRYSRNRERHVP
jgi:hypothetical protein